MNIITAIALFGAGYIYNEKHSSKPRINYSYKPYKNEEKTLKQYFKNLAMDKMDILFYGGTGNRNNRKSKISYNKYFKLNTVNTPVALFSTREGAWNFIRDLCREFERYGNVTVDNYYQFASESDDCVNAIEFKSSRYTYTKYGWTDADELYSLEPIQEFNGDWTVNLSNAKELKVNSNSNSI